VKDQAQRARPIGVLAALADGFDRVAARPALMIPPILLDLFLWLGPRLRVTSLFRTVASGVSLPPGADPAIGDQVTLLQRGLAAMGDRFNLFGSLATLPAGIPSLMASRMPAATPLGAATGVETSNPLAVFGVWVLLTIIGLGLGATYQIGIARQLAPQADVSAGVVAWIRFVILVAVFYFGLFLAMVVTAVVTSLATLILPLLGVGVLFVAFSLFFWVAVYVAFAPHGIIRYRFGVAQAIMESARVVRWNLPSAAGFVGVVIGLTWVAGLIWNLPADGSWFMLLAVLGHAFVSATILAASYAFYQGRRDWLMALRQGLPVQPPGDQAPRI
jgi:hypothetical protein